MAGTSDSAREVGGKREEREEREREDGKRERDSWIAG